jgi:hypothetical protein
MTDDLFGFLWVFTKDWPDNHYPGLLYEAAFWATAVLIVLVVTRLQVTHRLWSRVEVVLRRIGRHRTACVFAAFLIPLLLRCILLLWVPVPLPAVHDEFSYLLQADTFSHGRITNTSPILWAHFESYHINVWPTYQSMYAPGQALLLVFGQLFFGSPYAGVVLGTCLMCAVLVWAIQPWMPPQWAVLSGVFVILRFATFSYWMNSYFGGALAATGGALLFGVLGRFRKKPSYKLLLLYAAGLSILAVTRQYEGLVFSIVPTVCLGWALLRRGSPAESFRLVAPAMGFLLLVFASLAYYNWRSTGSPLLQPYMVNHAQYHITKPFLWQSALPIPNYHHLQMRRVYCNWELPSYLKSRTKDGLLELVQGKLYAYYSTFFWPIGMLMLPAWWLVLFRSPKLRPVGLALLLLLFGLLVESWYPQAHYAAPGTVAVLIVASYGFRWMKTWGFRRIQFGRSAIVAVTLCCLVLIGIRIGVDILDPYHNTPLAEMPKQAIERARIAHYLNGVSGRHLVLVHTRPSRYDGSMDWVYNAVEIDSAKIIWARDMGPDLNKPLLNRYSDRRAWYVDQNDGLSQLHAYLGQDPEITYVQKSLHNMPQSEGIRTATASLPSRSIPARQMPDHKNADF